MVDMFTRVLSITWVQLTSGRGCGLYPWRQIWVESWVMLTGLKLIIVWTLVLVDHCMTYS